MSWLLLNSGILKINKMLKLSQVRPTLTFNINYGMSDYSVMRLVKYMETGDIIVDFDVFLPTKNKNLQRGFVWTQLQKEQLIISILKGIKIPAICVILKRGESEGQKDYIKEWKLFIPKGF